MLRLDGVDTRNATSPTAVPPHDFRINLHHSSQRRGSRAHTYTGPTLGLLHAQAMEPETYHVGDMLRVMVPVMGRAGVWPEERVGNSLGQALQGAIDSGVAVQSGCRRTPTRWSSGR
jgi:hypothetical protein